VGLYSVAVRLSEVWYFIPILISSSLFPAILNAKKVSKYLYYRRLQRLYTLVIYLSLILSFSIMIFAGPLINFLYGVEYIGSVLILQVYVWSTIFVSLGVVSGQWYLSENLQILAFLRTFLGFLLNIVLNFFLIKKIGVSGAAISTLISYSFAGYFFDLFNKKTMKTFILKTKSLFILN
jgi:O-antigen/teichoic acid export membrane protein